MGNTSIHTRLIYYYQIDNVDLINVKLNAKKNNTDYFIKISNILNERYQKPHGYNQDKRMINFGLKIEY